MSAYTFTVVGGQKIRCRSWRETFRHLHRWAEVHADGLEPGDRNFCRVGHSHATTPNVLLPGSLMRLEDVRTGEIVEVHRVR
jgi:hypothetical protein